MSEINYFFTDARAEERHRMGGGWVCQVAPRAGARCRSVGGCKGPTAPSPHVSTCPDRSPPFVGGPSHAIGVSAPIGLGG